MTDPRPALCRRRLLDEGKPYPRSGCSACKTTIFTGMECLWKEQMTEADGDVTLHPKPGSLIDPGTIQKQEVWETTEFLQGMSHALKGFPITAVVDRNGDLPGVDFDPVLYTKGWNFGNAIAKPLLARIEMEKD